MEKLDVCQMENVSGGGACSNTMWAVATAFGIGALFMTGVGGIVIGAMGLYYGTIGQFVCPE